VEEGVAFCPHCQAPQIRVLAPEPGVISSPLPEQSPPLPASYPASSHPSVIDWQHALRAAGLAVLIATVPLTFVFGAPLGLNIMAAGFLSVALYRRRIPVPISASVGFRLGAVSGALGFGVLAILFAAADPILHSWQKIRDLMLDRVQQSMAATQNPQAPEVMEFLKTPAGMVLALMLMFIGFLIFSGLGGLLGAMLLGRRTRS